MTRQIDPGDAGRGKAFVSGESFGLDAGMEIASDRLRIWQIKQPLVAFALLFALGIFLQDQCRVPWESFLLPATGAALAWLIISWKVLPPPWPIVPWVILAGAWVTAVHSITLEGREPDHLNQLVLRMPQHVTLRGVVRTDPAMRVGIEDHPASDKRAATDQKPTTADTALLRSEFELRISSVKFATQWEAADGLVQVRLRDKISPAAREQAMDQRLREIEFGQEIEVDGVLGPPSPARNFGLFDFAAYLRRGGIYHVLQVEGLESIRMLTPAPWTRWIFDARKKLAARLTLGIEADDIAAGIIRGMLLGYREDIPPDVNDSFRRTGTLHVFAISGSHISLIAVALLLALRQMRIPQGWACWLVLPLLIFYVAATGLRASAIRSLVMAAAVIIGWSLQRPSALLNNLAASALLILAWDPFQLFDAGFQLSFGVVVTLILLAPVLDAKIRSWIEPDPYIPRICVPRWRLELIQPARYLTGLAAVCLAAWIGSLGLNLYYFNLVSFVALLANLLIVPLATASVALGLTSLLMGAVWNELAITLNTTHALIIHAMLGASEALSRWQAGLFYVPQPPAGWVVAGYALAVAVLLLWLKRERLRSLALAGACVIALVALAISAWLSDRVQFDILDVGGGQAVLITGPHFERVLVDAGSGSNGRVVVKPFLRSRGVNALDLAIVTLGDAQHYGGFAQLLADVPVRRLIVTDARFRSKGYRQLLEKVQQTGIPVEAWSAGRSAWLLSGQLTALWPPKDFEASRADDLGLALKLEGLHGRCILTADAGSTAEKSIMSAAPDSCQLLIQGLHSNEDTPTDDYLAALKPALMVLNTAEFPLNAYPSREIQERLRSRAQRAFRTDQSGGVRVIFEREGIRAESYFPQ